MEWNEAIEQAKEELGYGDEYIEDWGEVVSMAKNIYWKGESFSRLKQNTISLANNKCKICSSQKNLTAHHICYNNSDEVICVCNLCHNLIHDLQDSYGFIMQIVLSYWWSNGKEYGTDASYKCPNLSNMIDKCVKEIKSEIEKRKIKNE